MLFSKWPNVIVAVGLLIPVVIVEGAHSTSSQKKCIPLNSGLDPLVSLHAADPESHFWRQLGARMLRHQKHCTQSQDGADQEETTAGSSEDYHSQSSASSESDIACKPPTEGVSSSLKALDYPSPVRRVRFNPKIHYNEPDTEDESDQCTPLSPPPSSESLRRRSGPTFRVLQQPRKTSSSPDEASTLNSRDAEDDEGASDSDESLNSLAVQDSLRSISNQRGPPIIPANLESLRRRSGPAQPQTAPATQHEASRLEIYVWHEHSQKRTSVELEAGATLRDLYTAVAAKCGTGGILEFNRRVLDNMDASLASLRIGQHGQVLQKLDDRDTMIEDIIKRFNNKYELQSKVAQARPSGGLVGPKKEYLSPARKSEVIREFFARKEIVEIPSNMIRGKEDTLQEMVLEYLIHFDDNGFRIKDYFYQKLKSFQPKKAEHRDPRGDAEVYAIRTENNQSHSSASSSAVSPALFDLDPTVEDVLRHLELLRHKEKFAAAGFEITDLWSIDEFGLRRLGLEASEIRHFMTWRS